MSKQFFKIICPKCGSELIRDYVSREYDYRCTNCRYRVKKPNKTLGINISDILSKGVDK